MSLFVDVVFELLDSGCYGAVATLLLQTFEASEDTLGKEKLFFLDCLDILVLLFLFQIPSVNSKYNAEDNADGGNHSGNCGNYFS